MYLEQGFNNDPDGYCITIILPCRDEEECIERCLDSIIANEFPKERLEILVLDGMSEDLTREIVAGYVDKFDFIKMLDNPGRTQQIASNLAMKYANGDLIIRMDAHCTYAKNYISQCVHYLTETGADCVGGRLVTKPREETLRGKAIAVGMSEPFGVGPSRFRVTGETENKIPIWVDTVPFGCYRREVFDKVGLYREDIPFSEDMEFHKRMREKGCRILFVPTIISHYYARSSLGPFLRHTLRNGVWAILPTKFTGRLVVRPMHLVPLAFVGSLVGFGAISLIWSILLVPVLGISGVYILANIGVSAKLALREREPGYLVVLPIVFCILHVAYGLGSIFGLVQVIIAVLSKRMKFK